jgi:prepilin-type N-terminal cleavage/methylation domain-containing protein
MKVCPTTLSAPGSRRADDGFTLIEIVVVLAIIAVLAVLALPRYLDYRAQAKLAGHAQFVLETLRLARIEAVTREMPVSICASTDGTACTGTPWEEGWLVFSDEGLPGVIDGSDAVLRAVERYEGGVTLDVTITEASVDYFQFDPTAITVVQLDEPPPGKGHDYARLALDLTGETALAVLGITDAVAKKKDRRRDEYKKACSKLGSEKNPHCKEPLAVLEFCHDNRGGETGTAVRAIPSGEAVTEKIDCE